MIQLLVENTGEVVQHQMVFTTAIGRGNSRCVHVDNCLFPSRGYKYSSAEWRSIRSIFEQLKPPDLRKKAKVEPPVARFQSTPLRPIIPHCEASAIHAPVAQLDRVVAFEANGSRFESWRACQTKKTSPRKTLPEGSYFSTLLTLDRKPLQVLMTRPGYRVMRTTRRP